LPKELNVSGHRKRIAIIGAVAVGVVGIAGTALGAGSSSSPSFLMDFARRLGVSPAKVKSAYQAAMGDRLDQLVKDGKLTQAQANRMKQHLNDHTMRGGFGQGGPAFGFGDGRRHHMFGGPGGHPHGGPMVWIHTGATYLGITDQQLMTQLRAGKTPAAIAKAHGKTAAGLEQALVTAAKQPLADAVKSGRITHAQATKITEFLTQRIDQLVTHGFEHHGFWGGPPTGGTPPGGMKGSTSPSAQPTAA
jgi:polyhydroxyalkanoate synthesis regulator phasin